MKLQITLSDTATKTLARLAKEDDSAGDAEWAADYVDNALRMHFKALGYTPDDRTETE